MNMNGKTFIVLCSTAIGIVYAAGYSASQPSAAFQTATNIALPDNNNASATQTEQPRHDNLQVFAPTATPVPSTTSGGPVALPTPFPSANSSDGHKETDISPTPVSPIMEPQATKSHEPAKSTQPTVKPTPSASQQAAATPLPSPTSKSTAAPSAPPSKYKDGTFAGSGTNRFGTVEVDVTIAKGKISTVEITRSATRYPRRYIDSLPAEVIASQSADIDTVSGATRSSEDFINAVRSALDKAEQS